MRWALVVEDSEVAARDLEGHLRYLGFGVVTTKSVDVTEKALRQVYDLVALAAEVTNGHTYSLARRLRSRRAAVLFVTDRPLSAIPDDLGDVPLVRRPFTRRELERAVQELRKQTEG
jgi:DNA-binding response OmpR family regulator